MEFAAIREGVPAELVRSNRRRPGDPAANVNHPRPSPWSSARFLVKINANIGFRRYLLAGRRSQVGVGHPVGCGHGDGPVHRSGHPPVGSDRAAVPVPIDRPLYQAVAEVDGDPSRLSWERFREVGEQAEQGVE